MEFHVSSSQVASAPPLYDITLKVGTSVQFVQRVVYHTGETDFTSLIEAVEKKSEEFKCTYSSYGVLTEYVVKDGVFIINRLSNGGNSRFDISLETHYDTAMAYVNALQECLKQCTDLGKTLSDSVIEYIKYNQETALSFARLQQTSVHVIHELVKAKTEIADDTKKIVEISE